MCIGGSDQINGGISGITGVLRKITANLRRIFDPGKFLIIVVASFPRNAYTDFDVKMKSLLYLEVCDRMDIDFLIFKIKINGKLQIANFIEV